MSGFYLKISICFGFASLLFLAACRGSKLSELMMTPQPGTTTLVETVHPLTPSLMDQKTLSGAYPEPEVTLSQAKKESSTPVTPGNEAYPPPDVVPTTGLTPSSFPPLPDATLTPTTSEQSQGNSEQPYPDPESDNPLNITPTGTLQGINDQTATPTPTATMGLVRTELKASDPSEFSLVSGELQLVMFFADWSPISKSLAPVMHALEEKYQERITFVYLDIDDPANNLYKYLLGDRLPPVFFFLDGQGNVLNEWQGFVNPEDFGGVFASVGNSP